MRVIRRAMAALMFCAGAALAAPPAQILTDAVRDVEIGMLCQPQTMRTEPAPGTELGYINIVEGVPEIAVARQEIPAALGISFGLRMVAERTIPDAVMVTWRPGRAEADRFPADFIAGAVQFQYFSFEFPGEQVPGLWRMEAWDGTTLLYRVEFEVVPESALPDLVARCRAVS